MQERRQKENDELESIHDRRRQIATEAEHLQLNHSKLLKKIDSRLLELENHVSHVLPTDLLKDTLEDETWLALLSDVKAVHLKRV